MHRKLIRAIRVGDIEMANSVLEDGRFQFKASDHFGRTALLQALASNNKPIYVKLLDRGANPNLCDSQGVCVMNEAAAADDCFWLAEALAHGGDPNAPNTGNRHYPGSTPIFYAAYARKPENARLLIKAGANLNHVDDHGQMLLRRALYSAPIEMLVDLLEAGADPLLKDGYGGNFVDLISKYNESMVRTEEKKQSFRRIRAILIERGLLKAAPEELSASQNTKKQNSH
jgi:ankyrin repeat protein